MELLMQSKLLPKQYSKQLNMHSRIRKTHLHLVILSIYTSSPLSMILLIRMPIHTPDLKDPGIFNVTKIILCIKQVN